MLSLFNMSRKHIDYFRYNKKNNKNNNKQVSTLNAISCGSYGSMEHHPEMAKYVQTIEETIKKRVAINSRIGYGKLIEELKERFNNVKAVT